MRSAEGRWGRRKVRSAEGRWGRSEKGRWGRSEKGRWRRSTYISMDLWITHFSEFTQAIQTKFTREKKSQKRKHLWLEVLYVHMHVQHTFARR